MWQWLGNLFSNSRTSSSSEAEPQHAEPVIIMTCQGQMEAALYLSQLHDAGIPAASMGADSATIFGFQSGVLAEVRIVVPADYVNAACELLEITLDDDINDAEE